ncbi:MAG TPA: orotidine-5'-phosphate decarboxylase [Syntrophomonadaceae bacterium]|nr:orotidine-5'-phosphate decarboxylase [Syntrophomonadaceae bacterium]
MGFKDRLIVALDVDDAGKARQLVEQLRGYVGMFKVGLEPFCLYGPGFVKAVQEMGGRVFLDLKFHDIPRTAAQAARAAVRMGVYMFNVHIAGGREMLKAVVEAVQEEAGSGGIPKVLGVTVLTSLGTEQLRSEIGIDRSPLDQVLFWAELARECGLSGVVASPREVSAIRARCGKDFLIVTPGIRPAGAVPDDQIRISTPAAALRAGADYLVVGRPITKATDPLQAAREIIREMEDAEE